MDISRMQHHLRLRARLRSIPLLSRRLRRLPIAAIAEAEAAQNKWTMAIAIVDDGGNLVYFSKMDGTQIGSIDVALMKAKTAIRFKRPTKAFEDAVLKDGRSVIIERLALGPEGRAPLEPACDERDRLGVCGPRPELHVVEELRER